MWRAICTRPIHFKGKTYREGEEIALTSEQMQALLGQGVIGALKRIDAQPETADRKAPEDASRNYRGQRQQGRT